MEEIRKMLLKTKSNLIAEIMKSRESNVIEHEIGDEIDNSVEEQERELSLLLHDRDRIKLEKIEDALRRIEAGEYGFCEECGETITKKRLMAVPFARLCINCQKEEERTSGKDIGLMEEVSFRYISGVEE